MSENSVNWMNVSCDVPDYSNMTAIEYARNIHDCISRGHLLLGLHYLEAARNANVLYRMELAIQEFKNIQSVLILNVSCNNAQETNNNILAQNN